MQPLKAFQMYSSIKLHFDKPSYDYAKYGLNQGRFNQNSLERRNDKYQFTKLSNEYPDETDLEYALASTFVTNPGVWVGKVMEDKESFFKHKAFVSNPVYYLKSDLNSCLNLCDGDVKTLIRPLPNKAPHIIRIISANFNIQTFTLLERSIKLITYYETYYKTANPALYDIISPELMRIKKLIPFVRIDNSNTLTEIKEIVVGVFKN